MRILFLLHLPPPVHGSSIIGELLKSSSIINSNYDCKFINLLASKKISNSGHLSFIKIVNYIFLLFKLFFELLFRRPKLIYFALSTTGYALYKDFIIVSILKVFRIKIVL